MVSVLKIVYLFCFGIIINSDSSIIISMCQEIPPTDGDGAARNEKSILLIAGKPGPESFRGAWGSALLFVDN